MNKLIFLFLKNNFFLKLSTDEFEFRRLSDIRPSDISFFEKFHAILLKHPDMADMEFANTSEVYRFLMKRLLKNKLNQLYFWFLKTLANKMAKSNRKDFNHITNPFLLFFYANAKFEEKDKGVYSIGNYLADRFYHDLSFEKFTQPYLNSIDGGYREVNYSELKPRHFQHIEQFTFNKMPNIEVILGLREADSIHIWCDSIDAENIDCISLHPKLKYFGIRYAKIKNYRNLFFRHKIESFNVSYVNCSGINFNSLKARHLDINSPIDFQIKEVVENENIEWLSLSKITFNNDLLINNLPCLKKIVLGENQYNDFRIIIKNCNNLIEILGYDLSSEKPESILKKGEEHPNIMWNS